MFNKTFRPDAINEDWDDSLDNFWVSIILQIFFNLLIGSVIHDDEKRRNLEKPWQ